MQHIEFNEAARSVRDGQKGAVPVLLSH